MLALIHTKCRLTIVRSAKDIQDYFYKFGNTPISGFEAQWDYVVSMYLFLLYPFELSMPLYEIYIITILAARL